MCSIVLRVVIPEPRAIGSSRHGGQIRYQESLFHKSNNTSPTWEWNKGKHVFIVYMVNHIK